MADTLIKGREFPYELPVHNGAIAELMRPDINRLFISIPNIDPEELHALESGIIISTLLTCTDTNGLMIVFSFVGTETLTFDCPFDASVIPKIAFDNPMVEIVAVDSLTRIVVAIRYVSMKSMQKDLNKIIHRQLNDAFVSYDARRWIDEQRNLYTPEQLANLPITHYMLA